MLIKSQLYCLTNTPAPKNEVDSWRKRPSIERDEVFRVMTHLELLLQNETVRNAVNEPRLIVTPSPVIIRPLFEVVGGSQRLERLVYHGNNFED